MNWQVRRNTSTLHVDAWSFHDSLEALTQCSAQDGLSGPCSLLAMSCQFWPCCCVGPRTRLRSSGLQALTWCTLASQPCISYIGPDAGTSLWTIDALAVQRMAALSLHRSFVSNTMQKLNSPACHGCLRIVLLFSGLLLLCKFFPQTVLTHTFFS